jgi:FemAB-related protein (PEP-CTERM system-associated)
MSASLASVRRQDEGAPQVRTLVRSEAPQWEAFVAARPDASLFHELGWSEAVEAAMGHAAHPLAAWRGERIVGVLPLTHLKSRLFGDAIISVAFGVYGGILAEDGAAASALVEAGAELGRRLDVHRVELRHDGRDAHPAGPGWRTKSDLYATFLRPILPDEEANLKAIPRKKRADLRKALADHRLRTEPEIGLDVFYRVYAESVRNLGTPVFPRALFVALKRVLGDAVEISAVFGPKEPLAAVMTFHFRDRVMPYFGGAVPAARDVHAYDLLYWETMRRAAARGLRLYDFGRSKRGTGSFEYKTYWGFEPRPLAYHHLPLKGGSVPDINPLNPKYRFQIALWKRLPLRVANALGPPIARQLG